MTQNELPIHSSIVTQWLYGLDERLSRLGVPVARASKVTGVDTATLYRYIHATLRPSADHYVLLEDYLRGVEQGEEEDRYLYGR